MIRTVSAVYSLLQLPLASAKAAVDLAMSELGEGEGAARTFVEGTNGGRLPLSAIRSMVEREQRERGEALLRQAAQIALRN